MQLTLGEDTFFFLESYISLSFGSDNVNSFKPETGFQRGDSQVDIIEMVVGPASG